MGPPILDSAYCFSFPRSYAEKCYSLSHVQLFVTPWTHQVALCLWNSLEWVAISFSRWSSRPRDQTWVSCMAGRFFTVWATRVKWFSLPSCIPISKWNSEQVTPRYSSLTSSCYCLSSKKVAQRSPASIKKLLPSSRWSKPRTHKLVWSPSLSWAPGELTSTYIQKSQRSVTLFSVGLQIPFWLK